MIQNEVKESTMLVNITQINNLRVIRFYQPFNYINDSDACFLFIRKNKNIIFNTYTLLVSFIYLFGFSNIFLMHMSDQIS